MNNREEIIAQIFEAMNAMKRGMHAQFQDLPISRAQLEILMSLKHLQPTTTGKLARHLRLTPGAVSQLIDSLAQQDFVTRTSDPDDRRTMLLTVAPEGTKQIHAIEQRRNAALKNMMAELTDEELAVLLKVQQKIAKSIQSEGESK